MGWPEEILLRLPLVIFTPVLSLQHVGLDLETQSHALHELVLHGIIKHRAKIHSYFFFNAVLFFVNPKWMLVFWRFPTNITLLSMISVHGLSKPQGSSSNLSLIFCNEIFIRVPIFFLWCSMLVNFEKKKKYLELFCPILGLTKTRKMDICLWNSTFFSILLQWHFVNFVN